MELNEDMLEMDRHLTGNSIDSLKKLGNMQHQKGCEVRTTITWDVEWDVRCYDSVKEMLVEGLIGLNKIRIFTT